ncbi:ABC transporter permease [Geobacter anodireducens]|uniref:ABC transporter permease n=1 Tax=Geobacter anodireducens TaxID=1340425 RepID=A0ABR9NT05_9BACT|nr:FtsX-like permease family protein [Geobacter anodireducens]MBE2887380.1 ABC transporter permease [Geobacter anodireducens]
MTLHGRLLRRQLATSRRQSAIFVLCVALSIVTLVSLAGFGRSVHSSMLRDARALHGGDVIVESRSPLSPGLTAAVDRIIAAGRAQGARINEFYSIIRPAGREDSLLAHIKAVEPGYPFYGTVDLASGRPFRQVLAPGRAIAEQTLLDRLDLRVGDRLRLGDATLTVADVVTQEPDRPVNVFSLGPRLFVAAADLPSLGLVGQGSRVSHTILLKVANPRETDRIAAELRASALRDRERVDTYRTAQSGVKRFFDNFLFFLNLIGIFTLLLAGIGIQSSLAAYLAEQRPSIAVMKALGATGRFLVIHYVAVASVLGIVGTALGIGASFLLQGVLPELFRGLLPASVEFRIAAPAVAEGLVLGFLTVTLFTLLPLWQLRAVKPRAILGKEEEPTVRSRAVWATTGAVVLFFLAMVLWKVEEPRSGVNFVLGVGGLILLSLACTEAVLRLLRRARPRRLAARQALRGLFRPRNATRPIIVTLTAALAVIFAITLVERNLDASYIRSYPPDAPNLFFIDIQPGQKEDFSRALGMPALFHAIVRGTVTAINGRPIDREAERRKRGDNLSREFNLTYRDSLLEDERIVEGKSLFRPDWQGVQVSVLDTVVEMSPMAVGDVITFRVQGVPIEARISSIRTRTRAAVQPYFYFVFQPSVLRDAPQTLFTAVRVEKPGIAQFQNRIAARFPNVSIFDLTETVAVFARVMGRLSVIVRFFTLFSVVAGALIIVSSVIATRQARLREAVFFTILGARGRFVLSVFTMENLIIGGVSGFLALGLAQAASWIVCTRVLDVSWQPFPAVSAALVAATVALVVTVGLGASLSIIRKKPVVFLREQAEE